MYVLASALLSLGELVNVTNEILNGDNAASSLRVESDFKTGSFEVHLKLTQTMLENVRQLFGPHEHVDAAGLLAAIFGMGKAAAGTVQGLVKLYKTVRGEKPKTTLIDQSTHTTVIVLGDGNEVKTDKQTARLYTNERVIASLDELLRPLANSFDKLEVKKEEEVIDRLEREDLPPRILEPDLWEANQSTDLEKLCSKREALLRITKPNFEGGRWSFSDGGSKFGAAIEDQAFNDKVKRRQEGFFAGDTLHVVLRTAQRVTRDNKIEATYTVEKVLKHTHAPHDQQLPLEDLELPDPHPDEKRLPPPSEK